MMELYIHIPFCVKKCDYCDFVSFPIGNEELCNYKSKEDIDKYLDVLERELEFIRQLPVFSDIDTVFIGGGTPSVLSVEQMERILGVLTAAFASCGDAAEDNKENEKSENPPDRPRRTFREFTIECNPGTLTAEKLALYRKYGINRLSLGLQSTDDRHLRNLGRIHTLEQFLEGYRMARKAGFDNINVDLMSAIPGQTLDEWAQTLKIVAELNPEHISAYSLIIEEGTPFYDMYGEGCDLKHNGQKSVSLSTSDNDRKSISNGAVGNGDNRNNEPECESDGQASCGHSEIGRSIPPLPDEDTEREMYHITEDILTEYGYHRYEISNYAKDGFECRHNIGYWTGEEYIGIGLNSASYLRADTANAVISEITLAVTSDEYIRFTETSDFNAYCSKHSFQDQLKIEEKLDKEAQMAEYCILSLRLTRGIDTGHFRSRFKVDFFEKYGKTIENFEKNGLLVHSGNIVRLTREGFDLSNVVMAEFL